MPGRQLAARRRWLVSRSSSISEMSRRRLTSSRAASTSSRM
jgi:hypothetical protein